MLAKVSLNLCLICWISGSLAGSTIRFPDAESDKGGHAVEERYSDNQASAVIMQPNGVKRLPHFILPQVPSGQSPFGHVNPSGYAEGVILNQPSGRPLPNRHFKPNIKIPEKMKQIQRVPYRVIAKPPGGQLQTRKPLFAPKGAPPLKDIRTHPEAIKHKTKHPHFNKEQEFHHKPESIGIVEKEMAKLKGNKYYIKGNHPYSETTHPYKFLPTVPPLDIHQNFDKAYKDKIQQKDKYIHSSPPLFPSYQSHSEFPTYHEQEKYQESDNMKNSFQKHFVPVQEHIEEPSYLPKKEAIPNLHSQSPVFNNKKTHPTVEALADYINKWSSTNNYRETNKYTPFKEWGDLDEPNFEKAWLSGSEWVPIHAPAPPLVQENLQSYTNYDNAFAGSNNFANSYSDTSTIVNNALFTKRQGYSGHLQYPTQSFSNSLTSQTSAASNPFSRPQSDQAMNSYDLRAQIFQKPEVVVGKRPKSADVNNSHEVSAVFMVKQ